MTQSEFAAWLALHFPRESNAPRHGTVPRFVKMLNALREADRVKPVTDALVRNWLHGEGRGPDDATLAYLPRIEAMLATGGGHHFTVVLGFDDEEMQIIEHAAKQACTPVDKFVAIGAQAGVLAEIDIYRERKRKRRAG